MRTSFISCHTWGKKSFVNKRGFQFPLGEVLVSLDDCNEEAPTPTMSPTTGLNTGGNANVLAAI